MSAYGDSTKARPAVKIYTDGGCDPNPGRGGYGALLLHAGNRTETSGGFRRTTNNRMEIYAAIAGLELLPQPCQVTVFSDSQYVVNAMMKGWAVSWKRKRWWRAKDDPVPNADLWARLLPLCETHQVEFRWVRGHTGIPENERCDQLAMTALNRANLPADLGYEQKSEPGAVRPALQEGEPCWKCSTAVTRQAVNQKPKDGWYYEYVLACPKCQATYQVEAARRQVQQSAFLF